MVANGWVGVCCRAETDRAMARRPRGIITEAFVHVAARGNRGFPIYVGRRDYEFFLEHLRGYAEKHSVRVHAFCLMTNHFHLLLEAGEVPVSRCMHGLLARYAQYFNRTQSGSGHVFGNRFWSRVCPDDPYVMAVVRYIHLNPVRAGLAVSPMGYPWSSHQIYLGISHLPWVTTRCLLCFGDDAQRALAAYERFMTGSDEEIQHTNLRLRGDT